MLAKVRSSALYGIDAREVTVEVDVASGGLPKFFIVGLPDAAVRESIKRVKNAIINSGFHFPRTKITVNLAPAGIKKEGPAFDLPIALGILGASCQYDTHILNDIFVCGELSLDGDIRALNGILSRVLVMARRGITKCLIPLENGTEAALVKGLKLLPVKNLREAVAVLRQKCEVNYPYIAPHKASDTELKYEFDFSEVKGQAYVKRGLEIAAAGSHNVLLVGPPGSGKTMLAKRMPTILPKMSFEESLESTKIHSAAGNTTYKRSLIKQRPFRSPHHSASYSGLIGGGTPPRPGEITLAHNGILFLDEFPEFNRNILEMLRQPVEEGIISISRSGGTLHYPARFMLIVAMNPCPCGFLTHPKKECHCTTAMIQRYLAKISGPLLDRIDMHIEVSPLTYDDMSTAKTSESSREIRRRVGHARYIQKRRYHTQHMYNAYLTPAKIRNYCKLTDEAQQLLKSAAIELNLSGRAYDKILRISRTIADLAQEEDITAAHLSEAIGFRSLDRRIFAPL